MSSKIVYWQCYNVVVISNKKILKILGFKIKQLVHLIKNKFLTPI